jgi:aquaporin Z
MLGTFFLVLVGAGAAVVSAASHGAIGRAAAVTAPGLTVMAVILAIGGVSGAHLNPAVSIAFAARGDFPWRRVPGYIAAQATGSVLACLFLWSVFGKIGLLGATEPGPGIGDPHAALIEGVLTLGLVSTVLGTASGAQNLGPLSALGVSAYVILSGLWSSPVSGASMNPARSFGPDLVMWDFAHYWVYLVGPVVGGLIAVAFAYILRGPGDVAAIRAAQGTLAQSRGADDATHEERP